MASSYRITSYLTANQFARRVGACGRIVEAAAHETHRAAFAAWARAADGIALAAAAAAGAGLVARARRGGGRGATRRGGVSAI